MGNIYKEQFLENKKKITKCLDQTIAFMDELGDENRKNALIKQKNDLESGEFTIVVVGEFSAGKSTFLNALMGKKLLPSFTSETTATINFLRHKKCSKNGEEGCVYFTDGSTKEIAHADDATIAKYVSTKGEDVAETVHHLDLFMNSKFLENNVTLVDSPGLNGIASGHAEITKEQIQKSSASIFMFSARQPGSKTDFEVLADLSKRVSSIICVLNQIDAIKTNEGETVESVIKKLKSNYKEVMGDEVDSIPEIYPVSAYQALIGRDTSLLAQNNLGETYMPTPEERKKYEEKSRMAQFEERLFRYLTQGEKAKVSMSTPITQMEQMLNEVQGELEEERQLLDGQIDAQKLENQIEELEEKRLKLEQELAEKKKEIRLSLDEKKKDIVDRMKADADRLKNQLIRQMENWEEIEDIDPDNIKNCLERGLNKIAENAEDEFRDNNGRIITEYTDQIIDASIGTEFKFKISGELDPVEAVTIGIEEHQKEIERLEKEEAELKAKSEEIEDDFFAKLANEEKRENLAAEIKEKKAALENYEQISLTSIPSVRTYTEKQEKEHHLKKRKFFKDKVEYVMVDVTRTDNSERDQYIKERDRMISKKEEEIRQLEEELRNIPTGNVKAIQRKQQQIDAAMEAKSQERIRLNEEFRNKAGKKIEAALKKNKRMIAYFLEENIDLMKREFIKQYDKNENTIVTIISDQISATVKQKIEKAEKRIQQMKEEMGKKESDKLEKSDRVNKNIAKTQQILDEVGRLYDIVDSIPVDVIDTVDLED